MIYLEPRRKRMVSLDYTLQTSEERKAYVEKILAADPKAEWTPADLEHMADYLVFCMDKEERKSKKILTENRLVTINKRETSFEGLAEKFENGEDGVYNMVHQNKHQLLQPKSKITEWDIENLPGMKSTIEAIEFWKNVVPKVEGREKYIAKKALIEFRKQQYLIKADNMCQIKITPNFGPVEIELPAEEWIDDDDNVAYWGVSLCDPKVCSTILCNYSRLKQSGWENFGSDTYYLMSEFDAVSGAALAKYPLYYRIVELKIDSVQNQEIQRRLEAEFGICHSLEYISSLWRKKIPNLIASEAEDRFLNWYFTVVEKGTYKKCSRCGEIKLAHNKYFSKNSTSKDGFYSICKDCRNHKQIDPLDMFGQL